ncbi:YwmB family TATA-box binding protein [Defluviitalea phaphyphila]|uniref:YwmB family TATA-box binding protein n=1 Tax=Defluviitalea phaphyphila TaxID=1473580 RepID=UPI0007309D67|nr:YwmB family TATA-box binding protein [Defluviitalea phaphyphila]
MKKKFSIFFLVLVIVYSVAFFKIGNNINGEKIVFETFLESDFNTIQINLNSWGALNQSFSNIEELKKYANIISSSLGINNIDDMKIADENTFKKLVITRVSKNAKTTIKLESIKYENEEKANTYIIIDIILYGQYKSIVDLKEKIDNIFKQNNMDNTTNITITGTSDKKLTKEEKENIAYEMMENIKAKIEETYETENIYSVYGYTKLINDWLVSNNKKINVNIAFKYNEYEQKTYIYLATPVITVDY